MTQKLLYGIVQEQSRKVIHVVRVVGQILDVADIEEIGERMRQRALSRHGEQAAAVVIIQGDSKETLRLFGETHAVARVRTALFNAAIAWSPIDLD